MNIQVKLANQENLETAYSLMEEFHKSVELMTAEMESPGKGKFIRYWSSGKGRETYLLVINSRSIRVVLVQEIKATESIPKQLEVGATFIKEDYRKGNYSKYLYEKIIDLSYSKQLPIIIQIDPENTRSLKITEFYGKKKGKHFSQEITYHGRRSFIFYPKTKSDYSEQKGTH